MGPACRAGEKTRIAPAGRRIGVESGGQGQGPTGRDRVGSLPEGRGGGPRRLGTREWTERAIAHPSGGPCIGSRLAPIGPTGEANRESPRTIVKQCLDKVQTRQGILWDLTRLIRRRRLSWGTCAPAYR